jgi:hypothetical protein
MGSEEKPLMENTKKNIERNKVSHSLNWWTGGATSKACKGFHSLYTAAGGITELPNRFFEVLIAILRKEQWPARNSICRGSFIDPTQPDYDDTGAGFM